MPRRASYFSKSGYDGIYVGVRAGIQNVTPTDYATYSYPLFAEKDPVPVMYASESWFLRAEGALLGWTMGDTAENLYNTGVKTSLELWGNGSSYETYIASETAPALSYADPRNKHNVSDFGTAVSVKWADDGNELERIITQEMDLPIHMIGHEAWADLCAGRVIPPVAGGQQPERRHVGQCRQQQGDTPPALSPVGVRQQPRERTQGRRIARRQ